MTTTICVSGYPKLEARTLTINSVSITVAGSFHTLAAVAAKTVSWLAVVDRCRGCNTWLHTAASQHRTFGPPYCLACVTRVATHCRNTHGRLPTSDEFLCGSADGQRGCGRILHRSLAEKRDPDGRRRWRCHQCRIEQWRRANRNRKRRWG